MFEGGYCFEANEFMTESYFNPVDTCCIIQNISFDGIAVIKGQEIHYLNFKEHFMNIKFADGTTFGIKVE